MFDFLKRRGSRPTPRVHKVEVQGPRQIAAHIRAGSALRRRPTSNKPEEQPPRRGMWVVFEERVGILMNLELGDVATVMLVDEHGVNLLEVHCRAGQLRQAYLEEIPSARRPEEARGAAFGYTGRAR